MDDTVQLRSPAIDFLSPAIVYCCVVMVIAFATGGASGFGSAADHAIRRSSLRRRQRGVWLLDRPLC